MQATGKLGLPLREGRYGCAQEKAAAALAAAAALEGETAAAAAECSECMSECTAAAGAM